MLPTVPPRQAASQCYSSSCNWSWNIKWRSFGIYLICFDWPKTVSKATLHTSWILTWHRTADAQYWYSSPVCQSDVVSKRLNTSSVFFLHHSNHCSALSTKHLGKIQTGPPTGGEGALNAGGYIHFTVYLSNRLCSSQGCNKCIFLMKNYPSPGEN